MGIYHSSSALAWFVGATLIAALPADAQSNLSRQVIESVRASLSDAKGLPIDVRRNAAEIKAYYEGADSRPLWLARQRGDELIEALAKLQSNGLIRTRRSRSDPIRPISCWPTVMWWTTTRAVRRAPTARWMTMIR